MRLFKVFGAAALLAVSACTTTTAGTVADNVVGNSAVGANTVIDQQLRFAAEALYNVPAQAYVSADTRGLLNATTKARVKPILVKMGDVLEAARTAYRLANATEFNARYAELMRLKDEVMPLIPK